MFSAKEVYFAFIKGFMLIGADYRPKSFITSHCLADD